MISWTRENQCPPAKCWRPGQQVTEGGAAHKRLIQVKEGDQVLDEFKGYPTPVKGLGSKYMKVSGKPSQKME